MTIMSQTLNSISYCYYTSTEVWLGGRSTLVLANKNILETQFQLFPEQFYLDDDIEQTLREVMVQLNNDTEQMLSDYLRTQSFSTDYRVSLK